MTSEPIAPSPYVPGSAPPPPEERRRRRRWPWFAALLLLPLAFVFLAQGLTVQVTPREASVSLSGGPYVTLADRYLVLPGTYTLRATAPGYEPYRQPLLVEAGSPPQVRLTLQPAAGEVTVAVQGVSSTALPDAEITLADGQTLRADGEPLTLPAGPQALTVRAKDYEPQSFILTVAGRGRAQTALVQLERRWAELALETDPEGAEVWIDGEGTGRRTPTRLPVLPGPHTLDFKLDGYTPRRLAVMAAPRQDQTLAPLTLAPAPVQLRLSSEPAGAAVTLNGRPVGATPLTLALKPKAPYRLEVLKAGYGPHREAGTAPARGTVTRDLVLAPELGELRLSFTPTDAALRIDGVPAGDTGPRLQLPARPVTIEVSKRGYVPFKRTVTPRPGFPQALEVSLLTIAEARRAAMKPTLSAPDGQTLQLLRGGAFTMGASRREPGRRANEVLREVTVSRPFYLGTQEVTNAQFQRFDPKHRSGEFEDTTLEEPEYPVVSIRWLDAVRYCNWLSDQEGLPRVYTLEGDEVTGFDPDATGYRLPTEAEWAFAARMDEGGPPRRFPWGDSRSPEANRQGNYADDTVRHLLARTIPGYLDGHLATSPVGTFKANGFGLFDLGGNVAEWVNDFYGATEDVLGAEGRDPLGPGRGRYHVIRGSSWMHGQLVDLRLAFRDYGEDGRQDLGFRVARWFEPQEATP